MSRNEDIDNAIWADPDFEELSAHATLLYLWSWTNPRCDMAGIYKVSHRAMTESKVPLEDMPAALAELEESRFAFYEDSVLWVRARVKRLRSRSPQMAKSVAKDLLKIRFDHPLRQRFLVEYGSDPWLCDTLKDAYRDGKGNLSKKPIGKPDSHTLSDTSTEVPGKGEGKGIGTERTDLPEDFPRELLPHLRTVFKVLRELAVRHGSRAVSPLSLASVVMARPHKPLVAAVYDYVAWADSQAQLRKDVVSGYRNWLEKTNDLAGFERLGANGMPVGQVVPFSRGASSSRGLDPERRAAINRGHTLKQVRMWVRNGVEDPAEIRRLEPNLDESVDLEAEIAAAKAGGSA